MCLRLKNFKKFIELEITWYIHLSIISIFENILIYDPFKINLDSMRFYFFS